MGFDDKTRGTLFHEILSILDSHKPEYMILENVGNFERHDGGQTWKIIQDSLRGHGYEIAATTHRGGGGPGLISPHHIGEPHIRERFYIVGRRFDCGPLPEQIFPSTRVVSDTSERFAEIIAPQLDMHVVQADQAQLASSAIKTISHWNEFLRLIPSTVKLPSFPIWGDELWHTYPYQNRAPSGSSSDELKACLRIPLDAPHTHEQLLAMLPAYARRPGLQFPEWKIEFIRKNREWLRSIRGYLPDEWVETLRSLPPSHRKLEWNNAGGERDLWKCLLQFRPSGLRARRYTAIPALVAMTDTQRPILGPERRYLTRREARLLQGFPADHELPPSREAAFAALGNAVHVALVREIARRLLELNITAEATSHQLLLLPGTDSSSTPTGGTPAAPQSVAS